MQFYTVTYNHTEQVAVQNKDGALFCLPDLGISIQTMNELILNWDSLESRLNTALQSPKASPLENYRLLAPIPTPLQDIICLGVNYRNHIEETVDVIDFSKQAETVYFSKRANSCNYPGGMIPNYDFVDKLDYEAELGVILKKDAFQVPIENAADYIFGYTIINDVSARDIQLKHQQWYLGKSLDGYTPMGPCIVTPDTLPDPHNLRIQCYVNGEKRQDSNTRYMITSVEAAIAELSQGMTLKAGTIIATGTPGGVGMGMKPPIFLSSGDVIQCKIESIGILENTVA